MTKYDEGFKKVTMWHDIGNGIKWKYYRHWGQNYYAGEGLPGRVDDEGVCVDGSGGEHRIVGQYERPDGRMISTDSKYCRRPVVLLAREYVKGKERISAVLSYPGGLGYCDNYFWEIYPNKQGDCTRFDSEKKMESYIKRQLK